jgi:hypothetical protein
MSYFPAEAINLPANRGRQTGKSLAGQIKHRPCSNGLYSCNIVISTRILSPPRRPRQEAIHIPAETDAPEGAIAKSLPECRAPYENLVRAAPLKHLANSETRTHKLASCSTAPHLIDWK